MSDLPNTDSPQVMALVIKWEIVQKARSGTDLSTPDADIKAITNDVVKVYDAIRRITPIE